MKREGISKRRRFEIFKRDAFTCQYCGAHPPKVVLHVDHIVAVANGGANDEDNLVTSCQGCNQGKAAKPLTDVPQSLKDKAKEIKEREAQLLGYQEILEAKRNRIEDEAWRVAEILDPGSSKAGMNRRYFASIRLFNERLGVHSVMEAAEIARCKFSYFNYTLFRYFCGICWKRVRGEG